MIPLPSVIRKNGFELTMVRRVGRVAIYRQHLPTGNPTHDAYEVILAQSRNTNHEGEPVRPYECYPAAESWGKKGWTFTNLAEAVQKLQRLTGKVSRAGTVKRKNRFDSQGSIQSVPIASHGSQPVLARQSFGRPVGPAFKSATERTMAISLGNIEGISEPASANRLQQKPACSVRNNERMLQRVIEQ
jgi:hypothetical protein